MRPKRFTIMLVSGHGDPVRSFQTSPRRVIVTLAVLCCSFVVLASLVGFSMRRQARTIDQRALEARNRVLLSEVTRLEVALNDFQGLMAEQAERENTLRLLANMNPLDEDVWKVGVGGRQNGISPMAILPEPTRTRVAVLSAGVDELIRQAQLQQETYRQIEEAFTRQKTRLDATPSIPPLTESRLTGTYGHRPDPFTGESRMHTGLDFSAPKGQPVHATANGVVRRAGPYENYGNCVEIDHGQGIVTRYAHNSVIKVKVGQRVRRGDVISLVGMTGRATAPHCHYEVLLNGRPVNPNTYILPGGFIYD